MPTTDDAPSVTPRPPNAVEVALGAGLEWTIQRWVGWTGRAVEAADCAWLAGPVGAARIGAGFYERYAGGAGLRLDAVPDAGLLPDFGVLAGERFDPDKVDPAIRDFYERTGCYGLDAWGQWTGPLKPFARTLIYLISRTVEQLNLPTSPLDLSHGMTSEVVRLVDERTGQVAYAGWLRRSGLTEKVIYAGFYTTCRPPCYPGRCVKVVFPLPGGSATVILRPENQPDGSFKLVSAGAGFGDAGYYRIHRVGTDRLRVKYLPLKESIRVYVDSRGVLRTDHRFRFWGLRFLALHYKIAPVGGGPSAIDRR